MTLVKTTITGFMKNPKTGVLHNVNEAAMLAEKEARLRWRQNRGLQSTIENLEERIKRLEALLTK